MIIKTDKLIITTNHPSEKYSVENSFDRLWKRICEHNNRKNNRRRLLWRKVMAIAASVAILTVCGIFLLRSSDTEKMYVLNTENEKKCFTLPDSTHVWLNVNSQLTYTDAFGKNSRDVELSGEGYFEVTADAGKPFIVKTGEVAVRVLGTVFNVQAYLWEEVMETTLLEGSVGVMHKSVPEGGIILCPGQQLLFDKSGKDMFVKEIDYSLYTSWKDGKLVFKQTALKDAFRIMERNFRIKIVVNNKSLEERKITGRFDLTEKPGNILDVIRETLPFEYENQSDTLLIIK
ncbi:MAG: FecR domain-containing protein [Tannerella sp.]|jgi:ferric-dicitrate binding protein FerR (iron transport regulator)|nr:FecR domain-containing protein [Tannerella sp.]